MKNLTKAEIKNLRNQIDAALLPLLKSYGLTKLEAGNATFDPEKGTFKFQLHGTLEGAPQPISRSQQAREDYIRIHALFDLPEIDTPITLRNSKGLPETFTITGISATGKNIFITRDGKEYSVPLDKVVSVLAKSK